MDCNKSEASRAKKMAEKRFAKKDFAGAKKYAIEAHNLYPNLDGIAQMLATFDVYMASEVKINGESDFYSILGLNPAADDETVKKHYRSLALILHPDKNKTVGAEGAFKCVSEAWCILSDIGKRFSYDQRINIPSTKSRRQNSSQVKHTSSVTRSRDHPKSSTSTRPPKNHTFWTTCPSCKMQFEYLRMYLNNRLTCQNCHRTFMGVETGRVTIGSSNPSAHSSTLHKNGHSRHEVSCGTYYLANNNIHFLGGGSEFPSGFVTDIPSVTVQWVPLVGSVPTCHIFSPITTATVVPGAYDKMRRTRENSKAVEKALRKNGFGNVAFEHIAERPVKKMKCEEMGLKAPNSEKVDAKVTLVNRNGINKEIKKSVLTEQTHSKFSCENGQFSITQAFDARKMLLEKSKADICKKLEKVRLACAKEAQTKVESTRNIYLKLTKSVDSCGHRDLPAMEKSTESVSVNVPDSDFHSFDNDRLKTCFKPKQIWALYDDDDGMPRLYALIRKVVSVEPFQVHVSYLNAKSNSEFAPVNWVASGFNKTSGTFRVGRWEVINTINVFSHVVNAALIRRGFVHIFPKQGDIWAIYRNWSPNWDDTTPNEVRHQYEMVEVADDYTEEIGAAVTPLVKSAGFRTVFKKEKGENAILRIPRTEMFRFSHQIPSRLLRGIDENSLPSGCWDLDPAAIPPDVLNSIPEQRKDSQFQQHL